MKYRGITVVTEHKKYCCGKTEDFEKCLLQSVNFFSNLRKSDRKRNHKFLIFVVADRKYTSTSRDVLVIL